jgi:hypothetical protein
MMDVFEAFRETPYKFLKLAQGGVLGNATVTEFDASGIFKERNGMIQNNNLETVDSDATLHIRPTETFIAEVGGNLVGHGVLVNKNGYTAHYRIIGQVEGYNYDENVLEFYRLTLKAESLADEDAGSS